MVGKTKRALARSRNAFFYVTVKNRLQIALIEAIW
jgi:hypothetical protein